jgi:hypothetical protein
MAASSTQLKQPLTERQEWDNLVAEFDTEWIQYQPLGQRMGKILHRMKVHLRKHGLDRGRNGRWAKLLRERRIEESTARDWVVKYQQAEGISLDKCFFPKEMVRVKKTRKTHKYGKNNSAVPVVLRQAKVVAASEVDPDKADGSDEHRTAVECVFVLTYNERLVFMKAVRKLGNLGATQVIYRAVVEEAGEEANA